MAEKRSVSPAARFCASPALRQGGPRQGVKNAGDEHPAGEHRGDLDQGARQFVFHRSSSLSKRVLRYPYSIAHARSHNTDFHVEPKIRPPVTRTGGRVCVFGGGRGVFAPGGSPPAAKDA